MTPNNLLIGGFLPTKSYDQLVSSAESSFAFTWQSSRSGFRSFLWARGNHFAQVENESHVVVAVGHISDNRGNVGESALGGIERVLQDSSLVAEFEGSFALLALSKARTRAQIYRNIVGLPCIYYFRNGDLTLFSDNISYLTWILIEILNQKLEVDSSMLPSHFLFGATGRRTLFRGVQRVMPGEMVLLNADSVRQLQLLTMYELAKYPAEDCVDRLESAMRRIITEYAATYPNLVNMLSGGVDSSYIQAHLCQHLSSRSRTFSVDLLHPSWDRERQYARSAIAFFHSDHTFVKVKPSDYPMMMIEAISDSGLPLRNPQRTLSYKLVKSIKEASDVAICGMAGDSLFGLELCRQIDIARLVERLIPSGSLRETSCKISRSVSKKTSMPIPESLNIAFELDLHNCLSPMHPFHVYMTDRARLQAVSKLFGSNKVAETTRQRLAIMNRLRISGSLKGCLHSLAVAIDTPQGLSESFYQLASSVGLNLLHPNLDSRLIKTVLSFRDDLRFPFMQTKKVVKHALAKYLPKELIHRKKSGWGVPIVEWMAPGDLLSPLLREYLERSSFKEIYYASERKPNFFLWDILNFSVWHKQIFKKYP